MTEKPYIQYAEDVVSGKIVAGRQIVSACNRFLSDLKRDDLKFDDKVVDRAIKFYKGLRHTTGKFAGQPFRLLPWQQWILANILGFYRKDTGTRRFTQSYIEMCRKQGKTAFAAGLGLYYLIADKEASAEVDIAANSKKQAKIAFKMAKEFSHNIDPRKDWLKTYRDTIEYDKTTSIMNVFASDDSTLDGYNASLGIIDEYHSAPDSSVRDVIKSSMVMRQNPHLLTITTAGFDKTLPCYELRGYGIDVLNGLKRDDEFFVAIYEMDEEDDWRDEKNWPKCAPNLDITVSRARLRSEVNTAINNPREEVNVKTKNLNVWCDVADVWIPDHNVAAVTQQVDWSLFNPDEDLCYVGVDLAAVGDLTAVSYLINHGGKKYIYIDYYVPREALETKWNKEKYRAWERRGLLHVTPGNVTDYDYITQDIIKHNNMVQIVAIGYDKWNATQWAINCTELGMPLREFPQNIGNFNGPTRELERLILEGKNIVLDNNEINLWCFRNVELKADWNGNVKPVKTISKKKIDGVVATLEALGCAMQSPDYNGQLLTTIADVGY